MKTIIVSPVFKGTILLNLPSGVKRLRGGMRVRVSDSDYRSDAVQKIIRLGYAKSENKEKKQNSPVESEPDNDASNEEKLIDDQTVEETVEDDVPKTKETVMQSWEPDEGRLLNTEDSRKKTLGQVNAQEGVVFIDNKNEDNNEEISKNDDDIVPVKKVAKKKAKKAKKTVKNARAEKVREILEKARDTVVDADFVYDNDTDDEISFVDDVQENERVKEHPILGQDSRE